MTCLEFSTENLVIEVKKIKLWALQIFIISLSKTTIEPNQKKLDFLMLFTGLIFFFPHGFPPFQTQRKEKI